MSDSIAKKSQLTQVPSGSGSELDTDNLTEHEISTRRSDHSGPGQGPIPRDWVILSQQLTSGCEVDQLPDNLATQTERINDNKINLSLHADIPMIDGLTQPRQPSNSFHAGVPFGRDYAFDHTRGGTESNVQDRFELFLLGDGEKKVTEAPDTRTPNTSIFTFNKEDHTLGNLFRAHLLKDPHVNFAGYRVPHPLFATFELRIQTDGSETPKEALALCCKNLIQDYGHLGREFTKEFELRKMVGGGADAAKDRGL